MGKLIGYARVSTRAQDTERQIADLLAAGVRRDDLYVDHGVSGARSLRPAFSAALDALHEGDTLVITTLDRLGRSTANMLELATLLRERRVGEYVNYIWPRWDGYFWPRFVGLARCPSVRRAQRRVRPSRLEHSGG